MGKSSKLKQLRRLVAKMPEVQTTRKVVTIVTGTEVLAGGTSEINEVPIEAGARYKQVSHDPCAMNHYKNMKQAYKRQGALAVAGYVDAVNRHVKSKEATSG